MREHKYRVWNVTKKAWDRDAMISGSHEKSIGAIPNNLIGIFYENLVLIEYTGLKDKNGREIYECDVVRYEEKPSNPSTAAIMRSLEFGTGFWLCWIGKKTPTGETQRDLLTKQWVDGVDHRSQLEVIGNILENPEFIEVKQ